MLNPDFVQGVVVGLYLAIAIILFKRHIWNKLK